jgi:hypothetical protein
MRVEEQLASLEQYLGRTEEAYKNLAYFQLKALWRAASKRLEQFGGELARQQKDRERKAQLAAFERQKRERMAAVERELTEARVLVDQLQAEQKLAGQRLSQLRGFWNYFRRRALTEAMAAREERIGAAATQLTDLGDQQHAIASEPPPLFEGLSVDGRRAVNLAIVAYAEMLCDRLGHGGLADLARQSTLRRVFDASYGTPAECQALLQRAAQAVSDVERMPEDLAEVKLRADRLRRVAAYRNDTETVPLAESLSQSGAGGSRRVNVLVDEYWEIYKALVR